MEKSSKQSEKNETLWLKLKWDIMNHNEALWTNERQWNQIYH